MRPSLLFLLKLNLKTEKQKQKQKNMQGKVLFNGVYSPHCLYAVSYTHLTLPTKLEV